MWRIGSRRTCRSGRSAGSAQNFRVLGSPAFYRDPYPTYRALLDSGKRAVRVSPPIVAVPQYRDCTEVIRDARLSAARQQRQMAHFDEEQKRELSSWTTLLENTMIFVDPPEHTRVRKLLHRLSRRKRSRPSYRGLERSSKSS